MINFKGEDNMAKIRNSSTDNWYGEGKWQIFTDDDGKE